MRFGLSVDLSSYAEAIFVSLYIIIAIIYMQIYPDMAKHQSKPQVYKAPCGQI